MSYTDKATNQQPFLYTQRNSVKKFQTISKTSKIFTNRFVGFGRDQIVICN